MFEASFARPGFIARPRRRARPCKWSREPISSRRASGEQLITNRIRAGHACAKAALPAAILCVMSAGQGTAAPSAIPDFSGTWGRNVFNLEPLPSGPGPLKNLKRVGKDAAMPIAVGDPIPLVGDYMNPILKPAASAVVKERGEYSAGGHDFPDPSNQCAAQ